MKRLIAALLAAWMLAGLVLAEAGAETSFESVGPFKNGLARVEQDGKFGYVDKSGALVIPCQWDAANNFSEGFAYVRIGDSDTGLYGLIDTAGAYVLPCEWNRIGSFQEGFAHVEKDGKIGFIDTTGALAIPCQWGTAGDFSEGLACVSVDGLYGYIDRTGELVIPCQWESASSFSEGLACVAREGRSVYIDTDGTIVIPDQWTVKNPVAGNAAESGSTGPFLEGVAAASAWYHDDYWYGILDRTGGITLFDKESGLRWRDAANDSFSEGLAPVVNGNPNEAGTKYGYVDTAGEVIIPCQWEYASKFSEGIARVRNDGLYGFIDTAGEYVSPCQWESSTTYFTDGVVAVRQNGLWGAIDATGELLIPCEYSSMRYGEGYFSCLKDGALIVLDREGNRVN